MDYIQEMYNEAIAEFLEITFVAKARYPRKRYIYIVTGLDVRCDVLGMLVGKNGAPILADVAERHIQNREVKGRL